MAVEIKMPQLSDTMDSGKILVWNKQEGDTVDRGEVLAEVETDKANLEIESFHKGTLLKIVTAADQTAAVGDTIAYIGEAGESVEDTGATNAAPPAVEEPAVTEVASSNLPAHEGHQNGNGSAPASSPAPTPQHAGRVKASPLAKKLAAQRNIPLESVVGSGPQGRIVKRDIETHQGTQGGTSAPDAGHSNTQPTQPATRPQAQVPAEQLTPFSKMRTTIARRMQESVREAPHFYVTTSIEMDDVIALRKKLKERPEFEKLSINHFIVMATAYGISQEPRVNYAVRNDTELYNPGQINVGIITAIEDGLLIPVIHNADRLSLKDLVFEANAAVERARAGRPNSTDLSGGTFSISNMGMFDVENFTAIINPGQGSVLAVSSTKEQPVVRNGQIVPAKVMKATISVDHRIIDGVMAGNFLKAFKEALECPALLLVNG